MNSNSLILGFRCPEATVIMSRKYFVFTILLAVTIVANCLRTTRVPFKMSFRQAIVDVQKATKFVAGGLLVASLYFPIHPAAAIDQQYKLPPIDRKDANRCTMQSSSIGQANAARDKLYDLRECDLKGQDASGKDQSGMIASQVLCVNIFVGHERWKILPTFPYWSHISLH